MAGNASGASVLHKLKEVAQHQGQEVQSLATLYVIERFIARIAVVDEQDRVSVKGGQSVGFIIGRTPRPTKDLDINVDVHDVANPVGWCEKLITSAIMLDLGDGVVLDVTNARFERRNHQGAIGGLRIVIPASIHSCRVPFVVDAGINNEMSFEPTRHERDGVLAHAKNPPSKVKMRLFPFENTVAEKIVSKIQDGVASIRHKDFFDIWFIYETIRRLGDYSLLLAERGDMSEQEVARAARLRSAVGNGSLLSLPIIGISDSSYDRFAYALSKTAASVGADMPSDLISYFRTEFADDRTQSEQWFNWCQNNRDKFVLHPPGTEASMDRFASFHVLFDRIDPMLNELNSRLRSPVLQISPGPVL
jgi:hypothetical protein